MLPEELNGEITKIIRRIFSPLIIQASEGRPLTSFIQIVAIKYI